VAFRPPDVVLTALEANMSADASDFERAAGDAMRDFALSRSSGLAKYSNLLTRFGKGEIAAGAFSEEVLKLALEEGVRYAQDSIKLGSAYLGFMSQVTRAAGGESAPAGSAARPATAASSRRARTAPARSASRARKRRAKSRRSAKTAA
jgi:hypothetical protein